MATSTSPDAGSGSSSSPGSGSGEPRQWTFLTNHARVLLRVAAEPNARIRDIAAGVGLTERATHRIITDLVEADYVIRHRQGRRNSYEVDATLPMRAPEAQRIEVGEMLELLRPADG